jgi:hypothetical protein
VAGAAWDSLAVPRLQVLVLCWVTGEYVVLFDFLADDLLVLLDLAGMR